MNTLLYNNLGRKVARYQNKDKLEMGAILILDGTIDKPYTESGITMVPMEWAINAVESDSDSATNTFNAETGRIVIRTSQYGDVLTAIRYKPWEKTPRLHTRHPTVKLFIPDRAKAAQITNLVRRGPATRAEIIRQIMNHGKIDT